MLKTANQRIKEEENFLSPYAVFSCKSRGRKYKEKESLYRSCFQRDRDRILHTKALRRLKHKTQVFVALSGDHYRDRLTHSLEVSHIARNIARTLGLNEDLAESIALAHDLGHTPFGHSGEDELNQLLTPYGEKFEHNRQSRRICEELENVYPEFSGLNLSFEVIDGLIKHQSSYDQAQEKIRIFPSLEAQVVNVSDEIAYNCHDLEDGIRERIIPMKAVKKLLIWTKLEESLRKIYDKNLPSLEEYLERYTGHLIHIYCNDIYRKTEENLKKYNITTLEDVYKCPYYLVSLSDDFKKANFELKEFLMKNFYLSPSILKKMNMGRKIIRTLFKAFLKDQTLLPKDLRTKILKERITNIRDYIAGMTDNFARKIYKKINNAMSEM